MTDLLTHLGALWTEVTPPLPMLALAAAAIFFSGALRAYAGFGFALAGVPLLSLAVGPVAAVPMILFLEILSGLQMLPKVRHQADWRSIWLILPAAVLAAPLGVYLLYVLTSDALRILIALTLLGAVALMASGLALPRNLPRPAIFSIGGLSGLLAGSTAMAGPPVLLYFLGRGDDPAEARASLFMYFSLTGATTLTVGILSGIVTWQMMALTLVIAPALFLSNLAGHWAFHVLGDKHYRPIALSLLTVIAVVMLARTVMG